MCEKIRPVNFSPPTWAINNPSCNGGDQLLNYTSLSNHLHGVYNSEMLMLPLWWFIASILYQLLLTALTDSTASLRQKIYEYP